jgi:outer membrane receptor protein involved in Fe transport
MTPRTVAAAAAAVARVRATRRLPSLSSLLLAAVLLPTLTPIHAQTAAPGTDEETLELSPFVISGSSDVGYRATSSLAGTRIKTELRDLGAAISVLTQEFIKDSGATGPSDLLVYAPGAEVGGAYGNFTNSTFDRGRPDQQTNRTNPEANTRIRGLVSAELTRDYFSTDFSFDAFNTERVDISRGPNSLLFGVGSPGGVVNYSLKQPLLSGNRYEFSLRLGERGSHREVADANVVIVPKRVALRLSLLNDQENFRQEPAYEEDERLYAAVEAVLREDRARTGFLGSTKLRANFEKARVETTPTNVIAPVDNIRDWYLVPDVAAITAQTGQAAPTIYTNGKFVPQSLNNKNAPYFGALSRLQPWFIALGQVYNNPTGNNEPLIGFPAGPNAGVQGGVGRVTGAGAFDWLMQSNLTEEAWTSGFTARTFQDTQIYDFVNQLITGTVEGRTDRFENRTVSLEQLFQGGKGGLEFSFNQQTLERSSHFAFADFRSTDVWVDNNLWLANGQPNPNVGRPVLISRDWGNHTEDTIERETRRVTGFYDLDFRDVFSSGLGRWLGRHVFSGIVEQSERETLTKNWEMASSSDEVNMEVVLNGLKGNARRRLHGAFYIGPDLRPVTSYDQVRLSGVLDVTPPADGDRFVAFIKDPATNTIRNVNAYAEEFLAGGSARRRVIDSRAIAWQSYFLDNHLVGLVGLRRDRVRDTLNVDAPVLADGAYDPAGLALAGSPSLDASGDTKTWSVVAHFPEKLLFELPFGSDFSIFATKSENFQPTGFRQNVFLDPIAPPSGETEEYGFNLSILDNKFNLRVNRYETRNENIALTTNLATSALGPITTWVNRLIEAQRLNVPFGYNINGAPTGAAPYFTGYDQLITTLFNMVPEPLKSAANLRVNTNGVGIANLISDPVPGLASTSSLVAKGLEVEFVANPTRQWTIALNVAKQETVRNGSGRDLQAYYAQIQQGLVTAHLWDTDIHDEPNVGAGITYRQRFTRDFLNPLASILAADGTVSKEQRKWRWNLMTAYKFDEGFLKGTAVGGTVRWQDKAAAGYPLILTNSGGTILQTPDLDRPYYASATWNGDLFVRYGRKLTNKIDWTIQVNLRNYLGDQDLMPEVINPDGKWAVVRIPVERTVFVTNTFAF